MRCPTCGIEMRVKRPQNQPHLLQFFCRNPACPNGANQSANTPVAQRKVNP